MFPKYSFLTGESVCSLSRMLIPQRQALLPGGLSDRRFSSLTPSPETAQRCKFSEASDTELSRCRPRRPEKGLSIILPDLFIPLHTVSAQNKVSLGCPNYPAMPWDTFENMEIHLSWS